MGRPVAVVVENGPRRESFANETPENAPGCWWVSRARLRGQGRAARLRLMSAAKLSVGHSVCRIHASDRSGEATRHNPFVLETRQLGEETS